LLVSITGSYKVSIRYAAQEEWAGSKYQVAVGPQSLTSGVEPTGNWFQYKKFELGTVNIPKAGEYTVKMSPVGTYDHDLMYFQSVILDPVVSRESRTPAVF
jgi:hypothetical protein